MTESSEDIRKRYRTRLGNEFGDAFHQLRNEWAWSLMRRNEFRELFSRAEDVSLLNALTGGGFTWDIQHILWDDLLLRVCRLTDPLQSGRKDNLTVRRLPAFCEQHGAALYDQVQHLVDSAVKRAEFARDWRNRRISHTDLATAIGAAEPLAPASLQKVTSALDAVHAVLNEISNELLNAEIANLITGTPRARAFLAYARQLADSVKFVDAVVDPDGATRVADTDVAATFLRKLELRPTMQNISRVIELREAARRFT